MAARQLLRIVKQEQRRIKRKVKRKGLIKKKGQRWKTLRLGQRTKRLSQIARKKVGSVQRWRTKWNIFVLEMVQRVNLI